MPRCPACGASNATSARFCNACGSRLDKERSGPGETEGERRVVTMLFCDVRGSTSMAEDLDPEEWTDVMNAAFEHLIAPVYRYEGTVARLMGDAILAFFGAPTAHEDDPQRAVMAGLEIVSSIGPLRERLAREHGLDLDVRVGINTGPVVVGQVGSELRQEYSAMGDAVNVAARMEQTAEPGTVQITEDTYRLVAGLFDVEPLGEVELKGKRRPVGTYRVLGRLDAPWKVRATKSLEAPLVGRDLELSVLRSALQDVQRGRGSIALIVAEPGLGKSRLVEEANAIWAELHPGDDRRWDFWECVPYDTMQPYAQYRRLIRERAGIAETDPADLVRAKIADLMRLAPEGWGERSERVARALLGVELADEPRLEGEAFRREVTDLLVGSTLAQGGRRLVVFEDLHWCDQASLELVQETVRLVEEAPLVFLITFRPDRRAVSWGFRRWVESELQDRLALIELQPLSPEESDELIDQLLPVEPFPDDVRKQIVERTEGNPLFLQEVARALVDRGVVERTADGWRLAGDATTVAIPDTIQGLITAGLDRLPAGTRRTVQAAAVIGRTFDREVLAAVADGEVDADLRELEGRDLIRVTAHEPRLEFTFRHALTQEAAYGSLLLKRRRSVHRRVAEALEVANAERLEDVAPLLALHFGAAGDDAATLKYALVSGEAAARLYAHAEAEGHFRVALDVARRMGLESSAVRSAYERRGTELELAGRYDEAIENYEEMRTAANEAGNREMELAANSAIALMYSTATPKFDPERGRRLSEENVRLARALGDRAAEARALWNILVANVYGGGDAARAVEAGEASLAIARELGRREQIAFTLNDVCRAHMANGDFDTAARRHEEARGLLIELDNRPMLGDNLALASMMRLVDGDHEAALSYARKGASISESIDNAWGQSHALIGLYHAQIDLGDVGSAIDSIHRSIELGERGGFAYAGIVGRASLARIRVSLGDPDGALPLADAALELAMEQVPNAAPIAHAARADALVALGRQGEAQIALDEIDPNQLPEPDRTLAFADSTLARARLALSAGDTGEAASIATDLVRHLRSRKVRILVAEALVVLGRARMAERRFDDAERELADAIAEAEGLGERMVLWEALAVLARLKDQRADAERTAELRRRARAIVAEIVAAIADEDLRDRFLARAEAELGGPTIPRGPDTDAAPDHGSRA